MQIPHAKNDLGPGYPERLYLRMLTLNKDGSDLHKHTSMMRVVATKVTYCENKCGFYVLVNQRA